MQTPLDKRNSVFISIGHHTNAIIEITKTINNLLAGVQDHTESIQTLKREIKIHKRAIYVSKRNTLHKSKPLPRGHADLVHRI